MSQVPAPLSTTRAAHSVHASLWDMGGSGFPRGPSAIIDGLDPHAPSVVAPHSPDLLNVASTSHLLDETGRRGGARHNSSTRHDDPDTINHLCKTSMDGMCLEATLSAGKEAPQWPWGLRRLPRRSNPTPRSKGTRVVHPQKTNQLLGVGSGATEQWAQRGSLSKARRAPRSPIYGR
jgi:hypothetical protein